MCLAAAYGYMVLSWGGYSFIINLLPLYALSCIFSGRLTGEGKRAAWRGMAAGRPAVAPQALTQQSCQALGC